MLSFRPSSPSCISSSYKFSAMSKFFYSSPNELDTEHQNENHNNQEPRLQSELLSTGNQVVQSPPLTERLHEWRNLLIHQYNVVVAEWSNLKSATKNEIDSGREYINRNVLNLSLIHI